MGPPSAGPCRSGAWMSGTPVALEHEWLELLGCLELLLKDIHRNCRLDVLFRLCKVHAQLQLLQRHLTTTCFYAPVPIIPSTCATSNPVDTWSNTPHLPPAVPIIPCTSVTTTPVMRYDKSPLFVRIFRLCKVHAQLQSKRRLMAFTVVFPVMQSTCATLMWTRSWGTS
jgi:hypothetical protein